MTSLYLGETLRCGEMFFGEILESNVLSLDEKKDKNVDIKWGFNSNYNTSQKNTYRIF